MIVRNKNNIVKLLYTHMGIYMCIHIFINTYIYLYVYESLASTTGKKYACIAAYNLL